MEFDTEAVAQKIVRQILERTDAKADICLVLGSGWGGVSKFLENCVKNRILRWKRCLYAVLPGMREIFCLAVSAESGF